MTGLIDHSPPVRNRFARGLAYAKPRASEPQHLMSDEMSDASAESSEDSGTVKILQESSRSRLKAGEHYWSIHFSGCGFMLPYHFGAAACLLDHGITFEKVTASSGGVMAALALLRGADLHLGIRQCFDLRNEKATTPSSIRSFFAVYREYFRCFRNAHYRKNHGLQKLNGRLYVRLGRWTTKGGWDHCTDLKQVNRRPAESCSDC